MSVVDKVSQIITHTLTTDLADFLADRLGVDSYEVSAAVGEYLGQNPTPVRSPEIVRRTSSPKKPVKQASSKAKTCKFKITRGAKEGTVCGTVIRGDSAYCSKHKGRKSVS